MGPEFVKENGKNSKILGSLDKCMDQSQKYLKGEVIKNMRNIDRKGYVLLVIKLLTIFQNALNVISRQHLLH